jgi:hypothetical protein
MQTAAHRDGWGAVWAMAGVAVAWGTVAVASPPPAQVSLNNCQNAVKTSTATFIKGKVAAIGTCLQQVSTEIVKNNHSAGNAAATCVTQFRKINDTRGAGKSLKEKLLASIVKKCDPSQPGVTHALADVLGSGAGVPEPLKVENIDAWCTYFGGDGSIGSAQEWVDCIAASAECSVEAAISTQYPRALEWLALVKPSMESLTPPLSDTNKIWDAVAGLDAVKAAIGGTPTDGSPSIQCGASPAICGNGVAETSEACDGTDLAGQTCQGLGYTLGGTLACATGCTFNVSGCSGPRQLTATGQTTVYTTGDDGDVRAGRALSYADNGDGTITDANTGLMWEKKVDNGGLHDVDNTYVWTPGSGSIWEWVASVNAEGGTGYAGHNDWRIPNRKELESIVDAGRYYPAVDPAFNSSCTAGCTELTCSCTASFYYWSSTTYAGYPSYAWSVNFNDGSVNGYNEFNNFSVRAVRGGL